jgi:hypothetical protein
MKKIAQKSHLKSIKKISATALAVGTGIGVGTTVDAAVVYTDNVDISANSFGALESFQLDLNSDGVDDFTFSHYFQPQGYCGYGCYIQHFGDSTVDAAGANGAAYGPLIAGQSIGPDTTFSSSQGLGSVYYYQDQGIWAQGSTGYLGLKLDVAGQNYYGWARLAIDSYTSGVTLLDYAFENEAGKGILAGQMAVVPVPAMAPLFAAALGAMGVTSFRRRKRELKQKSSVA